MLVCSPLHYHVLFYGTSLHSFNVGNRAKLSIQVTVILEFFFFFFVFCFFLSIYLPEYLIHALSFPTFHVPCKLE